MTEAKVNIALPVCRAALTILALLPFVAAASAPIANSGVLTDADGYTLYTFDYDEANKSNCEYACVAGWTPLRATESDRPDSRLSIIVRVNGDRQWTLDARPLYLFARDLRPGDILGEQPGWAWHAIRAYPRPGLLDARAGAAATGPR